MQARTKRTAKWLGVTIVAVIVAGLVQSFTGISTAPVGGILLIVTFALVLTVATMLVLDAIRAVRGERRAPPALAPDGARGSDPAVAMVLAARARRADARRIVERDPLLALELRIGRPDQPTAYNDGGLVDLNSAPAQVIAAVCGIDLATAILISDARSKIGGFAAVNDVFSLVDLPFPLWGRIQDRAVVITS